MINQLGKFSSNLAKLTQPLRELLRKDRQWQWNHSQEQAFIAVQGIERSRLALEQNYQYGGQKCHDKSKR